MKIVVIIPTYNEKANIEKMIPLLEEEIFPQIKNHELEILVADDRSPDGTGGVVEKFAKKWNNVHLLEGNKEGLGAAYVRAMRYAMDKMNAGAVIEFDADFQHDPNNIPRLVSAMDEGADHVIGSRYIKGGGVPKEWGIHRKFLSFFGSLFARLVLYMFRVHDMTSGFKLTKSEYLEKVDLENLFSKYYAYKIQVSYELFKMGAKIKEIPIVFYERQEGSSKITSKDLVDSFFVVIKLRIRDSKSFIKFLIVGTTGFIINFSLYYVLVNHTGLSLAVSNIIAAQFAIFSNFNINNLWTFKERKSTSVFNYFKKMIGFYATSNIGVWLIQTGTIKIGDLLYGREYYIIYFVLGTGLLLIWNFTMYSLVIWRKKPHK